jgi:hypothetical protein
VSSQVVAQSRVPSSTLKILLLGSVLGMLILGGGGRLAMRGISLWQGLPPRLSFEGTLTVILLGTASGFLSGILRIAIEAATRRWIPRSPLAARAIWWAVTFALGLRVLSPWDMPRLVLFPPVILAYLLAYEAIRSRLVRQVPRHLDHSPTESGPLE